MLSNSIRELSKWIRVLSYTPYTIGDSLKQLENSPSQLDSSLIELGGSLINWRALLFIEYMSIQSSIIYGTPMSHNFNWIGVLSNSIQEGCQWISVFSNWKHIESSYSIWDCSNSIRALSNSTGDITNSIRVPFNWIRDLWDYWV